ncbi:MAG TPA: electron transfer flavoprotein subunit alpha/FixB family protein [Trueperaceae bacterium]|nr:electron transfer flavoprotein subunit alpha/FixB family protein [Trueperaceae bacterium]
MLLIVTRAREGGAGKSDLELVSAARTLAGALGQEVGAAVLGADPGKTASDLARYVGTVYRVAAPELEPFRAEPFTSAVHALVERTGAQAVLVAAGRSGQSLAPRLAVRLDAPLLEDVTSLSADGGSVSATRFTYLTRVTETVRADALPVVISVKPNVFPVGEPAGAAGGVEDAPAALREGDGRVKSSDRRSAKGGRVALEDAKIVVTGGRGVGDADGFGRLVEPLADAMGAGVGATRAVVDAGWRPYAEQVGQTGKTVTPDLYLALGVSGAVQHLSGMNRSKVIVAVNKDADAPIFKVCDYGIVGDVNEVVPPLTDAVKEHRS